MVSWPWFFKAASVQWEAFEVSSKPKFCQYAADLMCTSLGVSQGSDEVCMKTRMCGSGVIWVGFREASHWVGLHWWYCPVFSIKTPCGVMNRWGSGSNGRKWSGSSLNMGRLTCMWPWAGHLGCWLGEGEGGISLLHCEIRELDSAEIITHMHVGWRTMGCYCS